ncbi:MAG: hypothetical protein IPH31_05325 [Lewinellaceae bacterium]|nr:hypothetical protein [Lewinellaceae bacterium]
MLKTSSQRVGVEQVNPISSFSLHTQSPELNVDLKDYSIELFSELITDKQFWDTNGRITSISDLVGESTLVLR